MQVRYTVHVENQGNIRFKAMIYARRIAREEGLIVGISSGANLDACLQITERDGSKGKMIVIVFPCSGEEYMSTELFDDASKGPMKYKSIISGFPIILKEQGVRWLFRGCVPILVGYSAQNACKFGFYEFFKKYYFDIARPEYTANYKTLIYLARSASAEVIADVALCPMEAIKVRVQTQPGFARGLSDGFPKLVKAEGFRGLYKGLVPLWCRQIPLQVMLPGELNCLLAQSKDQEQEATQCLDKWITIAIESLRKTFSASLKISLRDVCIMQLNPLLVSLANVGCVCMGQLLSLCRLVWNCCL